MSWWWFQFHCHSNHMVPNDGWCNEMHYSPQCQSKATEYGSNIYVTCKLMSWSSWQESEHVTHALRASFLPSGIIYILQCQTELWIKFCIFYASATDRWGGLMFSGCPSVRESVRPSVRACVRASVLIFSLARLQENGWTDLRQIFTNEPSRVKDELIRFWPYMDNFNRNGGAKHGKICCFSMIEGERIDGFAPKFFQWTF